jgi:hypothetical protein
MGETPVTRPRTIRLLRVLLILLVVVGAGWLTAAIWMEGPAPRAVIPVTSKRWAIVEGLAFAPSGPVVATATLASSGSDGLPSTVRLWDCDTGKLRAEFCYGERWLRKLEFSSDGKRLRATFAKFETVGALPDGTVCWDVASATECDPSLCNFSPPDREVNQIALPDISPLRDASAYTRTANGWIFFSSGGIWTKSDGDRSPRKIADATWGVTTPFAVSPDGTQLVLNGPPRSSLDWKWVDHAGRWLGLEPVGVHSPDRAVTRVIDVASKKEIVSWPTPYADEYKFSPDGRTLALTDANGTTFYDAPLHFPWLRKLILELGVGAGTLLGGWLILRERPRLFWRRRQP